MFKYLARHPLVAEINEAEMILFPNSNQHQKSGLGEVGSEIRFVATSNALGSVQTTN
jgi:hypothetical protein